MRSAGEILPNLVHFGRILRAAGVPVSAVEIAALAEALVHTGLRSRSDVRDAARAVLVRRREHLAVLDQAFDLVWRSHERGSLPDLGGTLQAPRPQEHRAELPIGQPRASGDEPTGSERPLPDRHHTASALELLRKKDFAELSSQELDELRLLMRGLRWDLRLRRTRRRVRGRAGRFLDMRRTLRQNQRQGGELLKLAWLRHKRKRRPLVLLCDISGSMEAYSRVLLQFVYGITNGLEQTEAFVFGTRLTRITRSLRARDPDQALRQVAMLVKDWAGGTRIGETLKEFNQRWGRRVLGRGAMVLIISDGWDCGDIELLERQLGRLRRSCKRLMWLNPLLGGAGYEPLTRGIVAALPHMDDFLPVHNLESLEQLGRLLASATERPASGRRNKGATRRA